MEIRRSKIMEKKMLMEWLRESAGALLDLMTVDKESGELYGDIGILCGFSRGYEIHLDHAHFEHITEVLQVNVTYNPNWSKKYTDIEASFYLEFYGIKWKFFALFDSGEV